MKNSNEKLMSGLRNFNSFLPNAFVQNKALI